MSEQSPGLSESLSQGEKPLHLSRHADSTVANAKALLPLLFAHAARDDISAYQPTELEAAAQLAILAIFAHNNGERIIALDHESVKRAGHNVTVLTLVNDNKPFLLDSIMNIINEIGYHVYLVAHPVFNITKKTDTLILSAQSAETEAERVSVMQIHIPPLSLEAAQKLQELVNVSLAQVEVAVRDWQPMLQKVDELIAHYQKNLVDSRRKQAQNAIDFLNWLRDNNFTFLGMRAYAFSGHENPSEAFRPQGKALGILIDETIRIIGDERINEPPREALSFMESEDLLIISKANSRSQVHRLERLDYIGVKLFTESGALCGELRIVGLFTSAAYTRSVLQIPLLREKTQSVIAALGYNPADHSGKALLNVLETYPREVMFRVDTETLTRDAALILELTERQRLRILPHPDPFGRFVSLLVYLPRGYDDSVVREKMAAYFMEIYGGESYHYYPLFLEGSMTRLYYIIHRKGSDAPPSIAREILEDHIASIAIPWHYRVQKATLDLKATSAVSYLATQFPESYRDLFSAKTAIQDASHILDLNPQKPLKVVFWHPDRRSKQQASLKLFHQGAALALSQRVPLLENMGFRVIAEQTLELPDNQGNIIYLHDMLLENAYGAAVDLSDDGALLAQAFIAIWEKDADNDGFNALVQTARLSWQAVVILRHYGRYLQQVGIPYSQARLAEALNNHPHLARALYELFCLKFDPARQNATVKDAIAACKDQIENSLQNVPSLDDDQIIRRYHNLIDASLRSNAFLTENNGQARRILATKLNPRLLDGLPEPRPYREIFVYGPEVEGVHLRFGPVARGGIRWSDRALDYRTEILGLVKAQQVKNVVIVPVGSKGGFYPHMLPQSADRAQINEAGQQAYIHYISALLSITDNLQEGIVVPPKGLVRHDGDDPYFVVAADKGTATFSDTANTISQTYGFWLDDAFASGGSVGYDHKEMGITAKGAWEAVKRHFRELFNHDISTTPFTCVGVGDMSGDVFGNGMLLSRQTKLIAAFDHRDIFIDPNPDPSISYAERQRLFALPRSSWQDYDKEKLSLGGGVFSRNAKTITLSPQAAVAIGIDKTIATPTEIMRAILKAEVDLLWFGGIGTYIRASNQSDALVGDRTNDTIRITGLEVRAKVIGEGANLALTQQGRIEYCLNGGRCDTDAIDNSAGVNCSDVEVNIKIALAHAMAAGALNRPARDVLLKEMTDQVSHLVLRNNYLQPLALSIAEQRGALDLPYQIRFMADLERQHLLDRKVEILPDDQQLRARLSQGQGLTRPELSVIMAYAKLTLQEEITRSSLVDDPYLEKTLLSYFPTQMQENLSAALLSHPLRRDIIATLLANDSVNRGGPTFVYRLQDMSGQKAEQVVRAFIAVRDGFALPELYKKIDALDNKVQGRIQNNFYMTMTEMLFTTTGWLLRNMGANASLAQQIETISTARQTILDALPTLIPEPMVARLKAREEQFQSVGAEKELAQQLAFLDLSPLIMDIILIAKQSQSSLLKSAKSTFALYEMFRMGRIEEASHAIAILDYYDGMAVLQIHDKIRATLRDLTAQILQTYGHDDPITIWLTKNQIRIEDVIGRISVLIEGDLNISRFIFAASMLATLLTVA
ncbi:NAD-glutamate dehydrogenase [Bartonella sp. DGB2]|uniref:NAD-glutamate dehydrogenase n=1 Tax=Bartonella sp. DGB2 TaxID=3388426 RepID=UPI00398FB2B8